MSRVVVTNHLTLDGVMQAPGRADEDLRGGFEHGGWAQARNDEVMGRYMGEKMAAGGGGGALLLGRRTYGDFASFWPHQKHGQPIHDGNQQHAQARRFVDGTSETNLRLVDSTITTTGVVIANYVPSRSS